MSTTTAKKASTSKPKPAPVEVAQPKPQTAKPEPKTLVEALTTGQCVLLKVRANGTKRSLPYYAPGSETRKTAEAVDKARAEGKTVDAIAEDLQVSIATARRYVTGLALAQQVEAGAFNKAWKPGTKEVVVHTVQAKA